LQLIRQDNIIIIDDAYNSNENGAKIALETLALFDGFKILVTPGMVELGTLQDESNRRFGRQAAAVCDCIVLVGEKQTRSLLEGVLENLRENAHPEGKIFVVENLRQAFDRIGRIDAGDEQKVVLLENDLPDNY
jgi:UDP-N-acetylmuramoyl-tripeptide--D-alanyl-D-alanine ligase